MSKRVFNHPPEQESGKRYWRSLGQLRDTPEFRTWLEREFPQGASELQGDDVSRRGFLQLMGASVALAGMSLSACRRPLKQLVPFAKGVEWSVPGKALFFSSAMPSRSGAVPVVVTTFDGRPTKIEGNPFHPVNKGATDIWAQSSVLDLYDPHRSKSVLKAGQPSSLAEFDSSLKVLLEKAGDGTKLAFLFDGLVSPTQRRLEDLLFAKYPKAIRAEFDANGYPLEREAAAVAFGAPREVRPLLRKAQVILSVDRDFLGVEGTLAEVRDFAEGRKVKGADSQMNRLYVVENRYTLTGGMSDHRLRLAASRSGAFLRALAMELSRLSGDAQLGKAAQELKTAETKFDERWIKECAADLWANKGAAPVLVGQRQPVAVQVLGLAINSVLGNLGSTFEIRENRSGSGVALGELAARIKKGEVETLVILGGNPAFNGPGDAAWGDAQKLVKNVVHLSHEVDETSKLAHWHLPMAHYLEQWGDATAVDGSYMVVQPTVLPLYGGLSKIELLARFVGAETDPLKLVQETFQKTFGAEKDLTQAWATALKQGYAQLPGGQPVEAQVNREAVAKACAEATPVRMVEGTFELVFVTDSKLDDGRYANNGWLQELPDPITKLTWDNAALLSPAAAKRLKVETGDVLKVSLGEKSLEIPALILPGHADDSLSVPVGYGRQEVGPVGSGVGVNVYPLTHSGEPRFRVGVSAAPTGKRRALAVTQEHGAIEGRGADLTRQATLKEWAGSESKDTLFKKMGIDAHAPQNFSLYTNPPLDDVHAWGMTVDLNTCIGCSACMIACQAENNIPIVGKEQVLNGREMHWMRTDRYFATEGDFVDEPEMVSQPMMCQHCENAPCETVCPVNATVHSEDGLNVMAYNRCIGTRYCANNCPFKVRRFNFFDYNERSLDSLYKWNLISKKGMAESLQLQKNPNVTVRMRGVMEKCTFCVQRIQEAKIAAKVEAGDSGKVPRVAADAFTSACAQVCPTDAIAFGDLRNPESTVAKLRESERSYRLLDYLNTQNRVSYLARIRNPNPKMPDALRAGSASRESGGHGGHGGGGHGYVPEKNLNGGQA